MVLTIFVIGIISGGTTAQSTYLALGISAAWLVVSVAYFIISSRQKRQSILPAAHEMAKQP